MLCVYNICVYILPDSNKGLLELSGNDYNLRPGNMVVCMSSWRSCRIGEHQKERWAATVCCAGRRGWSQTCYHGLRSWLSAPV